MARQPITLSLLLLTAVLLIGCESPEEKEKRETLTSCLIENVYSACKSLDLNDLNNDFKSQVKAKKALLSNQRTARGKAKNCLENNDSDSCYNVNKDYLDPETAKKVKAKYKELNRAAEKQSASDLAANRGPSKVNIAKIKEGMTFGEVTNILGMGNKSTDIQTSGIHAESYTWKTFENPLC